MDELQYIKNKIENNEYILLPDTIAINSVYKISREGNLTIDGYEIGYLYIPAGSGIKTHTHFDDIERYKLLSGILKVNDESVDYNICQLSNSHNVVPTNINTIIQTCKVAKEFLYLVGHQTDEEFDAFVNNIINSKLKKTTKKLSLSRSSKKYLEKKEGFKSEPISDLLKSKLEEANERANEKISINNSIYNQSNVHSKEHVLVKKIVPNNKK